MGQRRIDHEHDFVTILIPLSEMRERCKHCTAVKIVPNPGDSDAELTARLHSDSTPDNIWMSLVARLMQLQYERETGLPAFGGSQEYGQWLRKKNPQS